MAPSLCHPNNSFSTTLSHVINFTFCLLLKGYCNLKHQNFPLLRERTVKRKKLSTKPGLLFLELE